MRLWNKYGTIADELLKGERVEMHNLYNCQLLVTQFANSESMLQAMMQ